MANVLSQDEINQLLTAINAGETEPEVFKSAADSRKIYIYDFKRPNKFSREQIKTISIIHETIARLATVSLSALLRSMVYVHVASVDQLTYEEFNRSIPTPTTLAVINMDPLKGSTIMEIDPDITFAIIDRLLGGYGEKTKSQHELTDIEQSVMEEVIVCLLRNLQKAWSPVIDLRPQIGLIETNPQFIEIVPPSEMTVLVTMETKVADVEGMINFCIPYLTIEPIMGKRIVTRSENYIPAIKEVMPVKLTAEILRRNYSLNEIKDWKEETIILPLCPLMPNHCYLRLGDRRVWYCEMMEDEKSYPKKIVIAGLAKMPFGTEDRKMEKNKVDPLVENALMTAKMMVTAELGAAEMTVNEIFGISEGTVIELDKLDGEPVDIKANGVFIAKGEVVVIDGHFGVRITETIGPLNPWAKQETTTLESQEPEL